MPLLARIVFGLCGAALALYAAASLTGNWLSTPPWWERDQQWSDLEEAHPRVLEAGESPDDPRAYVIAHDGKNYEFPPFGEVPVSGRGLISVGVGAVGLTLAAFAVLGRRRPEPG